MATPKPSSIDTYIAAQPKELQAALKRVRAAIRKAMPRAEETISYKIPAYRLHGRIVLFFAGWKEHYSLYPAGARTAEAFAKELAPYEIAKGTIRFPLAKPVPVRLIGKIARLRAKEAMERATKRTPAKRARLKKSGAKVGETGK